jgi:plastocyanin
VSARRHLPVGIRTFALGVFVVGWLVAACGSGSTTTPPSSGGAAPSTEFTIVAEDIAFQPASLLAPSGSDLHVTLDNRDDGIPHNLKLLGGPDLGTVIVETEVVTGPVTQETTIPGLEPGAYRFMCVVHPNMTVDLTVEG